MIDYFKTGSVSLRQVFLGCLLLVCSVGISSGQSIYKTVDAEGKVSYSTQTPDDKTESQTLDLLAEPSETDMAEAQKRIEKIQQKLEKKQEYRDREAERNAQDAATGPGTVVLVPPTPPAILYPYANYHEYGPHRRGHRYGHRQRYGHHYRQRVIGPYRPLGPSLAHPGYASPLPSQRYSGRSRY